MEKRRRFMKYFFQWMGALLLLCFAALALSGKWAPPSLLHTPIGPMATIDMGGTGSTPSALPPFNGLNNAKNGFVIVLDAGHGGPDGGASTPEGVPEAGLNLAVAKLVESGLKEAGFTVRMTRETPDALGKNKQEDMAARKEAMREEDVSAVVSIHMNKFRDTAIHGPMAFYMKGSEEGERLASAIIETLCVSINNPKRSANPGDYFVLKQSVAPAVIVECGFLSNAVDAKLLQDKAHQQKLADGIVAGVMQYFAPADASPSPSSTPVEQTPEA